MARRKNKLVHRKNHQSKYHVARAKKRKEKRDTQARDLPCTSCSQIAQPMLLYNNNAKDEAAFHGFDVPPLKPTLRVLSLFDGIATALHVLEKLGFYIEVYYSSEIDEKAIKLQRHLYEDRLTMLGSVTHLTHDKLHELGRINLLVGGSPCSDLSLVNPRRRGLYGPESTGTLFFDYVRILNDLRDKAEKENYPFYWLFENTRNMQTETRLEMSRKLGCEPVSHNASSHLPVERNRLFWGNLPNMAKEASYQPLKLNDVLPTYRFANVDKVPTLTTSTNSQRSGSCKVLPVCQDGEETVMFITEIESLFGFPKSYTDGPNLSLTDRRKLLGKSFCVPVIEHLLNPLKEIFWHK